MAAAAPPPARMPDDPRVGSIQQAVEIKDLAGVQKRVMHRIVGDNRNPSGVTSGWAAVGIGLMFLGALGTGFSMYMRVANPFAASARPQRTAAEALAAQTRAGGMGALQQARLQRLTARWMYLRAAHEARNPQLYVPDVARAQAGQVWRERAPEGDEGRS